MIGIATMARSNRADQPAATEAASSAEVLALPSVMDLLAAEPLRARLLAAITAHVPITLTAGDVERLSTPCAQVLLAAARSAKAAAVSLRIVGGSADFLGAVEDLGLSGEFEKWLD